MQKEGELSEIGKTPAKSFAEPGPLSNPHAVLSKGSRLLHPDLSLRLSAVRMATAAVLKGTELYKLDCAAWLLLILDQ